MEQRGVLKSWDDQQGFGFISGAQGDIFVHISAVKGNQRPTAQMQVYYVAAKDGKGGWRATHMRGLALAIDEPEMRQSTNHKLIKQQAGQTGKQQTSSVSTKEASWKTVLFLLSLTVLGYGLTVLYFKKSWRLLAVIYLLASLFSFVQYWIDKRRAQENERRIPESSLHLVEFLGGWPGAFLAQKVLRHKTRKFSYQLSYWLIVLLHLIVWVDVLFLGQALLGLLKLNL